MNTRTWPFGLPITYTGAKWFDAMVISIEPSKAEAVLLNRQARELLQEEAELVRMAEGCAFD